MIIDVKSNSENIKIFASTGGKKFNSKLPSIIFLHGAGMDHTVWSLQSRYFAHRNFSVLAIDFPGNGRSEGNCVKSIEEMADWVHNLILGAGLKSAILVGHSMGALVALESAYRYSKFIKGLCLIGVSAEMPVNEYLLKAATNDNPLAYDLITSWSHGQGGHFGKTSVPGLSLISGSRALMSSLPKGSLGIGLNACNLYKNGLNAAKGVLCPTLCVLATDDKMTPSQKGKEIADLIPDAKTCLIKDCGHMIMLEKSDECLKALKSHFKNFK
tara:strand:+ start:380 stop:1192 length:813 start_codon:yes stop_codon:yes gene_type:complete